MQDLILTIISDFVAKHLFCVYYSFFCTSSTYINFIKKILGTPTYIGCFKIRKKVSEAKTSIDSVFYVFMIRVHGRAVCAIKIRLSF